MMGGGVGEWYGMRVWGKGSEGGARGRSLVRREIPSIN